MVPIAGVFVKRRWDRTPSSLLFKGLSLSSETCVVNQLDGVGLVCSDLTSSWDTEMVATIKFTMATHLLSDLANFQTLRTLKLNDLNVGFLW